MTSIIKRNADNYPIKSVTVFKSNTAEVIRVFDVSLQPGQNNIQISHLAGSIDTDSARVSGLADAQLSDVVCSVGRGIEEIDPLSTGEVVRKLRAKKKALVQDREALDDISDTMVNYSKTLAGDTVSPDQAGKFFDTLLTRSQTLRTTRVELEEEILQLTRQIDVLSSAEEIVQNATWSAAYELHATTDAGVPSPSVSLHYRARITQSTGEDWTDVALTLSTADMNLSTQSIPTLIPTKIRPPKSLFGQSNPAPPMFAKSATRGLFGSAAPDMSETAPTPADDGWQAVDADTTSSDEPVPIAEPTAVVHESPLALTYHIDGASRVPSDGVPHQLAVAVLPFSATLQHVAVPKARPVAYLHATVRNTSDYRLLAGPVHAFVDDAFAARTALPRDAAPGDTFHCTLGSRPRHPHPLCAHPPDAAARAFSEQWATTAFASRTTITNSHPFALRALVLRDAVPVSEDGERVNVVLRRPAALADLEQGEEVEVGAEDEGEEEGGVRPERRAAPRRKVRWCKSVDGKGGRKEGLFEWVVDVGAGEEVTIETEWDVKTPGVSLRWIESVQK
ncbi:hypothetical protein EDB85DRAFT_2072734 [Lactarius pseudohatsudake]|nr:hypothetical protein EDB85DRAFT_2072734 [Lactarius pseudohatsudake]